MDLNRVKEIIQERITVLNALIASEGDDAVRFGLISGKTELVLILNQIYLEDWINGKS